MLFLPLIVNFFKVAKGLGNGCNVRKGFIVPAQNVLQLYNLVLVNNANQQLAGRVGVAALRRQNRYAVPQLLNNCVRNFLGVLGYNFYL